MTAKADQPGSWLGDQLAVMKALQPLLQEWLGTAKVFQGGWRWAVGCGGPDACGQVLHGLTLIPCTRTHLDLSVPHAGHCQRVAQMHAE